MTKTKRNYWLVVHNDTGAMDGIYYLRSTAESAAQRLFDQHGGTWLVVNVLTRYGPGENVPIPSDKVWHLNVLA